MNKLLLFGSTVSLMLLIACKSKKEVPQTIVEPPKPAWISQRPNQNTSYIGIGMAQKAMGPDYAQRAKNNALNDLASEISVEISSTSLLYQVESNNQFKEDFQSNTKTKNTAMLSGYEQVDVYENSTEYWVIYQLDKRTYQTQKEERLQRAIALSKDHLANFQRLRQQNLLAQSLPHLFKAIETIEDFWAEPLTTQWNNQEVYLGNYLFRELLEIHSSLQLVPANLKPVKRGITPGPIACFTVQTKQGKVQGNIPVALRYSGGRLKQSLVQSNSKGEVLVDLLKITSPNSSETLKAIIDIDALVDQAGGTTMLHQLILGLPEISGTATLPISQPQLFVTSTEQVNGKTQPNSKVKATLIDLLQQERTQVVGSESSADFKIHLSLNSSISPNGNFFTANTSGELQAFSNAGVLLIQLRLSEVKGIQSSPDRALDEAYKKMEEELKRRHFRDLRRQLFDQ